MPKKKKSSYKACNVKGCRKKALSPGKCKDHSKKSVKKSPKKTVRKKVSVKRKKKSIKQGDPLKDICFELGAVLGKLNRLVGL